MKKLVPLILILLLTGLFNAGCTFKINEEPATETVNINKQAEAAPTLPFNIDNELDCQNYLKGKTFYGSKYRIEIDTDGKVKLYNKEDNSLFFESQQWKDEIGSRYGTSGRKIKIHGSKWIVSPINGMMGTTDGTCEMTLFQDGTLQDSYGTYRLTEIESNTDNATTVEKIENFQSTKTESLTLTDAPPCNTDNCVFIFKDEKGFEYQASYLPKGNVIALEKKSDGKQQVRSDFINKQYLVKYERLGEYDNEIRILELSSMPDKNK